MTCSVTRATVVATLLAALAGPAAADGAEEITRGDAAWARRAEGHQGGRAAPGPLGEAVAAYEAAVRADPRDLEARWKLARALYYRAEYVEESREARLALFERGREVAEAGIDQLAAAAGGRDKLQKMKPAEVAGLLAGDPNAPALFFWAGAHWGLWGETRGKMAAARQGVAGKVRDYAEIVVALDEHFEQAGGRRVLGRLHAEAPRIPFITGWVDHDRSIEELERTLELYPRNLLSQLYLVEALLDYTPARRAEALERLRTLAGSEPDPAFLLEETKVIEDARALLAELSR